MNIIRYVRSCPGNGEAIERFRGLVVDKTYCDAFQASCDIIVEVLKAGEWHERQEAFDLFFDLLRRDVAEVLMGDEFAEPDVEETEYEQFGKPAKRFVAKVISPNGYPQSHTIEVFADGIFVNGEQIGGV